MQTPYRTVFPFTIPETDMDITVVAHVDLDTREVVQPLAVYLNGVQTLLADAHREQIEERAIEEALADHASDQIDQAYDTITERRFNQ